MNPELQLLITCCKTTPSNDDIAFIRSQLITDYCPLQTSLPQLAHAHGIFPLFYQSLKTHAAGLIPDDALQELKQQYMAIVQHNMLMTAELIRIMKLLQEKEDLRQGRWLCKVIFARFRRFLTAIHN